MTLGDLYERKWDETVYIVGRYNAGLNVIDSNDLLTSNGRGKYLYKSFIITQTSTRKEFIYPRYSSKIQNLLHHLDNTLFTKQLTQYVCICM